MPEQLLGSLADVAPGQEEGVQAALHTTVAVIPHGAAQGQSEVGLELSLGVLGVEVRAPKEAVLSDEAVFGVLRPGPELWQRGLMILPNAGLKICPLYFEQLLLMCRFNL